jgi:hypothetical protein
MQNAIIVTKQMPDLTMSVDSIAYFGQNGIRRNVAKTTSFYTGTSINDRTIEIPAQGTVNLELSPVGSDGTKALYLDTNQPLQVGISTLIELTVSKHLFLDHPVNTLVLENPGGVPAVVKLSYIV